MMSHVLGAMCSRDRSWSAFGGRWLLELEIKTAETRGFWIFSLKKMRTRRTFVFFTHLLAKFIFDMV